MKKLSCMFVLLALLFVFGSGIALAGEENVPGGWEIAQPCIDKKAVDIFKEATKDLDGAMYEPLYLAATQVVTGTNYLFICKQRLAVQYPQDRLVKVIIYQSLDKKFAISSIEPL